MGNTLLITAFVLFLGGANVNDSPEVHPTGGTVELGRTIGRLEETVGGVGVTHNGWSAKVIQQGNRHGETAEGQTYMYSVQREFRPLNTTVRPVMAIGPAYVVNSPFVGRTNYHLSIGAEVSVFRITANHYSNAGMTSPNTGLDNVSVQMILPF